MDIIRPCVCVCVVCVCVCVCVCERERDFAINQQINKRDHE